MYFFLLKYLLFPIFVSSIIDSPSIIDHQLEILVIVNWCTDESIIVDKFILGDPPIIDSLLIQIN